MFGLRSQILESFSTATQCLKPRQLPQRKGRAGSPLPAAMMIGHRIADFEFRIWREEKVLLHLP